MARSMEIGSGLYYYRDRYTKLVYNEAFKTARMLGKTEFYRKNWRTKPRIWIRMREGITDKENITSHIAGLVT